MSRRSATGCRTILAELSGNGGATLRPNTARSWTPRCAEARRLCAFWLSIIARRLRSSRRRLNGRRHLARPRSSSDAVFGAVDDVGRVAEISDGCDLVAVPAEQHEISRRPVRGIRVEHQDGRASLNQPGHEMPVADAGIIAEIARHLDLAAHARLVDEIEPDVVGDHGADGVEIAGIEMRDIGGKLRPFGFG